MRGNFILFVTHKNSDDFMNMPVNFIWVMSELLNFWASHIQLSYAQIIFLAGFARGYP
jgi:hypothetical protein